MGEVLKATDTRLQRAVAVKVLPESLSSDGERRSRFEREARSASALNHPNIAAVYDVGEDAGVHYIVMELVEGKTLREVMSQGSLSTSTILPLVTQIAEGLSKAHSAGIVHRDLKPENVMVTDDGLVKILDFGLAKLVPQASDVESEAPTETQATQQGTVLGTVPYMSPEQAAGRSLDHRSDQFSFGSILYEMATGRRAFRKDTTPQTLAAIIEDDPEPMERLNDAVPGELSAIVERCLAKDPAARYESTGDLARELRAVPETPSPGRARRWFPRAGAGLLAALLAAALAPALVGLWDQLSGPGGTASIESIAVLPLRNLSGDPEQEYFADGMTEALITDLARVGALKVIGRHSVMRYKETDKPLLDIAGELGVDAVVEGSALRVGNTVRIMAQLVDPKTGVALWAESYERGLEDVLFLQGEVARAIVGEVAVAVTPEETGRLAGARTVVPAAHDAYLRGSYHWNKLTPEDLQTAQRYFELALEKDPIYAPAYEGLARVWGARQQMDITHPREAGPKARAAATRALELDDSSPGVHATLAMIRTWSDWDWPGAEPEWRRALELDPNDPRTHAYFAHFLAITGRTEEAVPHGRRALELDPLNALVHGLHAMTLYEARRYDEAMATARAALAMQPNLLPARAAVQLVFISRGMREEQLADQRERIAGDPERVEAFERGLAEGGYEGAQLAIADLLAARYERSQGIPDSGVMRIFMPASIALRYRDGGDYARALDWLERAFEVRDPNLPYLGSPLWDPVRSDPRYQELMRRMNLPSRGGGREG
jgi:TolB-like protein/Tfp pilus assembly protein PilF